MSSKHLKQKTLMVKKEEVKKNWLLFDAAGKTLGRLSAEIAKVLRGKHKPTFTPNVDNGDGVIIVNADKVRLTGSKEAQKIYRYYTGHVGGLREVPFRVMQERKPEFIIKNAVKGMMPKTKLSRAQLKSLRIYAGEEHGMAAQKPIKVNA